MSIGRHQNLQASAPERFRFLLRPRTAVSLALAALALTGIGAFRISSLSTQTDGEASQSEASQSAQTDAAAQSLGQSAGQPLGYALGAEEEDADLTVYVSGAVEMPGVVTVEAGSRVVTAVEAAGGLSPGADAAAVNLAQPLTDGAQVHVPELGVDGGGAPAGETAAATSVGRTEGCIDLNSADSALLEELPGIGPKLAAAIVEERTSGGAFATSADLDRVPGIGPKLVQRVTEAACQ